MQQFCPLPVSFQSLGVLASCATTLASSSPHSDVSVQLLNSLPAAALAAFVPLSPENVTTKS